MRFFPDCYISRCFISVVSLFLFTSCFTGIESTPKITAKHLSKEGIAAALPPEESFCVTYVPIRLVHGIRENCSI